MTEQNEKVVHLRFKGPNGVSHYGGATVVFIPHYGKYLVGYALCSPKDRYQRKLGRMIARGRAHSSDIIVDLGFQVNVNRFVVVAICLVKQLLQTVSWGKKVVLYEERVSDRTID